MRDSIGGHTPRVDDTAFVSKMAYLIGDVEVGERASLWPFVCLRGDDGRTVVGSDTNVQEFSMLHGARVGDRVSVGHNVVIDYATVEDDSLVGMSSVVLRGARVESKCIVAAGSVVLGGQTVPEGHMAYGIPAAVRPLTDDQLDEIESTGEHYVRLGEEYKRAGGFERE